MTGGNVTSVRTHLQRSGHGATLSNFQILNSGNSEFEVQLLEKLHIHSSRPSLNGQFSSVPLELF